MDWEQCIICQQVTHEVLRCPLNAGDHDDNTKVYASFLTNVSEFRRLGQLPVPLKFKEDIHVEQLVAHKAKWHKTCHLKFNDTKLQRARKREGDKSSDSTALQNQPRLQHQPLDRVNVYFALGMMDIFMNLGLLMQIAM